MRIWITSLFCLGVYSIALSQLRISAEGGSLINKPLVTTQHTGDNGTSTAIFDITTKHYTSSGYFARLGVDLKLASKKSWRFYVPMGMELNQHVAELHQEGYFWGCFGGGLVNETRKITSSMAGCFVGLALEYSARKWESSLSLIVHNNVTYKYEVLTKGPDLPEARYEEKFTNHNRFLSGQLSLLYKCDERFSIGPACEVYFYNLNNLVSDLKTVNDETPTHKAKLNMRQGGDNIWICLGFKLRVNL